MTMLILITFRDNNNADYVELLTFNARDEWGVGGDLLKNPYGRFLVLWQLTLLRFRT